MGPFCVQIVGRIVQRFASLLRIAHKCTIFAASPEEEVYGWCRCQAIRRRTWASMMLVRAAAVGPQRRRAAVYFCPLLLNTTSIMFTYYYRVWQRVEGRGYIYLVTQGSFLADSTEAARSHALKLVRYWGNDFGDCSLEYSIWSEARSPYVVYYPPF